MIFHEFADLIHVSWVFQAALVAGLLLLWMGYAVSMVMGFISMTGTGMFPDSHLDMMIVI